MSAINTFYSKRIHKTLSFFLSFSRSSLPSLTKISNRFYQLSSSLFFKLQPKSIKNNQNIPFQSLVQHLLNLLPLYPFNHVLTLLSALFITLKLNNPSYESSHATFQLQNHHHPINSFNHQHLLLLHPFFNNPNLNLFQTYILSSTTHLYYPLLITHHYLSLIHYLTTLSPPITNIIFIK